MACATFKGWMCLIFYFAQFSLFTCFSLIRFSLFNISTVFLEDLLLVAAFLMELASQSSKGINKDISHLPEEQTPIRFKFHIYSSFAGVPTEFHRLP